jgi:hypothetical protein
MKKTLLLASLLAGATFSMNAQTVLFEDSFESYNDFEYQSIGQWSQIDVDGRPTYGIDGASFTNSGYTGTAIVFNPASTTPTLGENWTPRTGSKSLNFFAAVPTAAIPANNDYFVTPQITLGASDNNVSFWAKSITANWGLERIRVLISTTGNAQADFTTSLTEGNYVEVPIATETGEWTEFSFNLDAYADQNVYIAINYLSSDSFALLVDDFSVTTASASVDSPLANSFSVYPNPAKDMLNISNSIGAELLSVTVTDLNGRTVKQINSSVEQINISDLNAGVYFVNINSTEGSLTKKIVKK